MIKKLTRIFEKLKEFSVKFHLPKIIVAYLGNYRVVFYVQTTGQVFCNTCVTIAQYDVIASPLVRIVLIPIVIWHLSRSVRNDRSCRSTNYNLWFRLYKVCINFWCGATACTNALAAKTIKTEQRCRNCFCTYGFAATKTACVDDLYQIIFRCAFCFVVALPQNKVREKIHLATTVCTKFVRIIQKFILEKTCNDFVWTWMNKT